MMMTTRHAPAPLCIGLGALAACGFAPLQLWPLTLLCFAAWLGLVHDAPTIRAALLRGWLFGLGHFTINDNWIQHAFDFQDAMPPLLGYAAPVLLALYLAVYPMMAAGVMWRLAHGRAESSRRAPPDWPFVLIAGAAWIATEWLRATMFTGYAWDPLAVIWVPVQPVAAIAALTGTYALAGLTVVLAGAMLLGLRTRRPVAIAGVTIALAIGGLAQALSYRTEIRVPPAADAPRLRVVQPAIGQQDRSDADGPHVFATLARLSGRPGPAPRLVVWPEGMLRDYPEDGYPADAYAYAEATGAMVRARIAGLLGPRDVLMTGGDSLRFDADGRLTGAANSVFAIDAAARLIGRYDKAHLVPYGEYLPMPWLLKPLGLARLVPGDMDFAPGPGPRALPFPGMGPVGVQLCYEIIFSGQIVDEAHRPRLLFNPSNDAWFGRWGPPQHLAQARMRAIEEGLPIVRATPTGISAVIAADGRLIAHIPAGTAGAIDVPVPPAGGATPFSRMGNGTAAIVALALMILAIAIRRRAR